MRHDGSNVFFTKGEAGMSQVSANELNEIVNQIDLVISDKIPGEFHGTTLGPGFGATLKHCLNR